MSRDLVAVILRNISVLQHKGTLLAKPVKVTAVIIANSSATKP